MVIIITTPRENGQSCPKKENDKSHENFSRICCSLAKHAFIDTLSVLTAIFQVNLG